jgi:hypothetical protein
MWCCWISPDHNPASSRAVAVSPNIGPLGVVYQQVIYLEA